MKGPNITGQAGSFVRFNEIETLGALSKTTQISSLRSLVINPDLSYGGIYFDASKSNSLYGGSVIVQPLSIVIQYLIKY